MRAVVQRVSSAAVTIEKAVRGSIDAGLLVYLGVDKEDQETDATYLADKIRHLRIFRDEQDRMNRDVVQATGKVLVISAFTVSADARRGRRPSFDPAASHEQAVVLYEKFCDALAAAGVAVERGTFRAMMDVESVNAGPVCILLDSRRVF